ncbi:MAG: 4Fe-4S dicluster domain-containing protein [Gemmatimonadetes bacterium]|nr:4Fe-4S dicluster domain-containing protein [Gemmatimonadota bacterium]MYA42477.1 4Fe-4S dicluster domain-containing protein [Gemmatimonadota bacterium]MYE95621.1 4Fe-4S dicluster domain-containing protein [Gemmatimonadota bacterium]MYJ11730.1 4Fe-4S dicluster domain-containing protein [Gemmatimonadota bacterium]
MGDGFARRDFLKVVGAGSAGAAVAGCSTDSVERLIPYVTPPEEITPGVATWYASTCGECAGGCGIRVRTREGRAVMIEGNPDHPVSRGGVCSRGVSALQALYNPDRVAAPMLSGPNGFEAISWDEALEILVDRVGAGGRSLFLTGRKGPTEGGFLSSFVDSVGGRRVIHDALDDSALRRATEIAFGVNALPRYDIAAADFLVSFGADFLETWLSPVSFGADFAAMHGVDHGTKGKFVFVGSRLSLTGQNADEWIPAQAGSETQVALAVAGELIRRGADAGPYTELVAAYGLEEAAEAAGVEADALAALADQFEAGTGLALGPGAAGHHQTATAANLAVLILNAAAGSLGRTMHIDDAPDPEASSYAEVAEAIREMSGGVYGVAVVAGTNPAYSLPPAAGFRDAFALVPFKVAFATTLDETSAMADLVLPDAHALESWADAMPSPGTYSVRQPAMRPVPAYDSRPMSDVLLEAGRRMGQDFGAPNFHDYLRGAHDAWLAQNGEAAGLVDDPNALWRELLRTGSVSYPNLTPGIDALRAPTTAVDFRTPRLSGDGDLTLLVYPSPRFGDGTHANRPWLQELPDPVSKIMWHSWAELNPATAERLGLRSGDVVNIASANGAVEVPVWTYPGIREDFVALAMGGGHTEYGQFANGNGVNPMELLPEATDAVSGTLALVSTRVTVTPTGAWRRLTSTEGSSDQDDRNITPAVALSALGHAPEEEHGADDAHDQIRELQEGGGFRPVTTEGLAEDFPLPGSDFGEYDHEGPRWAMAIDLDKCTGCGACVTACQAENNIPWVGEVQATMGREMHWMRLERYYETVDASHSGPVDIRFLPMLCQHCNNAPCEPVCPVFAAYHTPDGLNAQAYNRCVGTRYCANNCPYKVRVFNWYRYTRENIPEPMNWQFNPDVTVRDNGVMEKCTFCVQRIRDAGNRAAVEGRDVRDGEVRPACQSVCPADVIRFGNIRDHESQVAAAAADERTYRVLDAFINTQPAVHYLKKVTHHDVDEGGH